MHPDVKPLVDTTRLSELVNGLLRPSCQMSPYTSTWGPLIGLVWRGESVLHVSFLGIDH